MSSHLRPITSAWPHMTCDVNLEEGILTELSLCYSSLYHHNGAVLTTVLTRWWTGLGFDLAWFSSLSSEWLCILGLHDAIYSKTSLLRTRI